MENSRGDHNMCNDSEDNKNHSESAHDGEGARQDNTQLDGFPASDEKSLPFGRPHLLIGIDANSKLVVGLYSNYRG